MTAPSKIPHYLFQVLEAEYIALYTESPAVSTPVQLFDHEHEISRDVMPTFDWTFDATHVKDPRRLIEELNLTPTPEPAVAPPVTPPRVGLWTRIKTAAIRTGRKARQFVHNLFYRHSLPGVYNPDKVAKDNLTAYMREELKNKSLDKNLDGNPAALVAALNSFLTELDFFQEDRFSYYWLDSITRGMRDVHVSRKGVGQSEDAAGPLEGEDRMHFNRLLLEAAFPDCLEKIHNIRLAAIYQRFHKKQAKALCLSGGGIRSGTFALGLLQGLARNELLDKFEYLSTVSGGGYIGSWLAAWIHRHPKGLKGVMDELANEHPKTKVDPDPEPIRYLRRYSNFITPKVGVLSADTWTFIGIYLRNLLLNWMVFIPILLAVLMLPRLGVAITIAPPNEQSLSLDLLPTAVRFLFAGRYGFLVVGLLSTVWAIAYIMFNRPSVREELRQASSTWRSKAKQKYFLRWCLLPLTTAAFCLTTYWIWSVQSGALPKSLIWFLTFGGATTSGAWVVSSWVLGRLRSLQAIARLGLHGIFTRDLGYLLASGAGGGFVLWAMTQFFTAFAPPIVEFSSVITAWRLRGWIPEIYTCFAVPAFMLVFLLGATLFIGLSSKLPRVNDEDREWWSRLSAWVLIVILGWTSFDVLVLFGPIAFLSAPTILTSFGGISGVLAALIARSAKTPGVTKSVNGSEKPSLLGAIMARALPLLALIFIVFLLVTLSLVTSGILAASAYLPPSVSKFLNNEEVVTYWHNITFNVPGAILWTQAKLDHMNLIHLTPFRFAVLLFLIFGVVGYGLSRAMNLNIFSLHGGYRNRLIRAFLGASRPDHQRKPNPFTGFDPADNIAMHEVRTGLFDEDDFLKPVELAQELLNHKNSGAANGGPAPMNGKGSASVLDYLSQSGIQETLKTVPNNNEYSDRLIVALRTGLNQALQDPNLTASLTKEPTTDIEKKKAEKKLVRRTTNRIALNRKILEFTFRHYIKHKVVDETYRLLPIINTTLNLVGGDNLAWQQRKAEPFSISPLYAGCFRLGYRDSKYYGGRDTGGISIGTAAAISGAAASSNMGYYTTSPLLSLVLTFFNVRLGWWLGNPGPAGNQTFQQRAPTSSVTPIVEEALGLTDDENEYVYLTDGGHFENLGLYEMVLRRCHVIVVSDAAADGDYRFGDLGNAIRKVRIDLGIPIEFTAMPIFRCQPGETKKGMYWAVGRIRYSCIDGNIDGEKVKDGLLFYIKPAIYGAEPRDVLEYQKTHPTFPHQTTADQFFDEPQFESYRILGSHIIDQICGLDFNGSGVAKELKLTGAIGKAVEKLLDASTGGPADPLLKDWWQEWQGNGHNPAPLSFLIS